MDALGPQVRGIRGTWNRGTRTLADAKVIFS